MPFTEKEVRHVLVYVGRTKCYFKWDCFDCFMVCQQGPYKKENNKI